MTKTATIYVIDPAAATIEAVEIEARSAFSQTYTLIDCRLVEVVPFDTHHKLIVDEEGLRDGLAAYSMLDGYPQALAGKLVLVGEDDGDFVAAPKISIEEAAKRFCCVRPVLDPVFATVKEDRSDVFVIGTILAGFETRLESTMPTVIGGDAG
jgi:hypothetical protein